MAKLYWGYHGLTYGPARRQLEVGQAAWLQHRMSCGKNLACIATAYRDRVRYLHQHNEPDVCDGPILEQPGDCDAGGSLEITDEDIYAVAPRAARTPDVASALISVSPYVVDGLALGGRYHWRASSHQALKARTPSNSRRRPTCSKYLNADRNSALKLSPSSRGRNATGVWLYTRNGSNFADRFPRIVEAVKSLPVRSCFIDGEAIVVDSNGLAVFDLLRSWRHNRAAVVYAFDVIELDGENLRRTQIEQRKRALANLLSREHEGIALNRHYDGDGTVIYKHACALGCEGIVSKPLGSTYRSGRVNDWLKIKNPAAPAAKREADEDWGNKRWGHGRLRG
jgi:hypothetical protein